jgi:hypothetical protein
MPMDRGKMRLSPVSLIALLAVLAIVAYLTVQSMASSVAGSNTPGVGSGGYQGVIKAAQQSVAQQNAAAGQANSQSATPTP